MHKNAEMLKRNHLKQRLRGGQPSLGCWMFSGSPVATEILVHCGFDALLIDHEHSPGGIETAVEQLRAADAGQATILARLSENRAAQVKRLLDIGVEGVIAANVEQVAAIEEVVAAAYYPPIGRRGAHYTVSRAAGWGADADHYPQHAAAETLVIAMIESIEGVDAITDLAKVGHVDMFFIGPLDLSASIGVMGEFGDPAFVELLDAAERRIAESGVALGGAAMPGHNARQLFARGYRFVTASSDVGLLRAAALSFVHEIHREAEYA
jgi:4-hydroxy-2-oxoheptanedioate aldolase